MGNHVNARSVNVWAVFAVKLRTIASSSFNLCTKLLTEADLLAEPLQVPAGEPALVGCQHALDAGRVLPRELRQGVVLESPPNGLLKLLRRALAVRCPPAGLIVHFDQGSQYTAIRLRAYRRITAPSRA